MDAGHLRQILWNLFLNATESIEGEGRIKISIFRLNELHACIRISDTGCGIPEKTLKIMFDPFFTTKSSGTGLGLSIVHRLIESNNGLLEVKSIPGKGTDFLLKFREAENPKDPSI